MRIKWYFFANFQNFTTIKNFWIHIFVIFSIHKHSLGSCSCEVRHKILPRLVQLFSCSAVQLFRRLLDINGQSDRQTSKVYIYIYIENIWDKAWPSFSEPTSLATIFYLLCKYEYFMLSLFNILQGVKYLSEPINISSFIHKFTTLFSFSLQKKC